MISNRSLTKEWIQQKASELGKRGDPKMLEKVIRAFLLLEQLQVNEIPLIFKGGTSLLLLLDPPRRFSIDIDLIIQTTEDSLTSVFNKIVGDGFFISWKPDNERKHKTNAPVGHYKFYYQSVVNSNFGDEPILLDVLYSDNCYSELTTRNIAHKWLITEGNSTRIQIPSVESILGDKLTAFAPETAGILYSKNRPVEIIKQLFDIGTLFNEISDLDNVKQSYISIANKEIEYRKLDITYKEILDDTFQAALIITTRDAKDNNFRHMQTGINNLVNFIIERFTIEEAVLCAAKAAYLSRLLQIDSRSAVIERYSNPSQLIDLEIKDVNYNKLNRLKKSNPEAFFYWLKAINLV
jgi:predicted nucleotidyltransferase component of viral defense system